MQACQVTGRTKKRRRLPTSHGLSGIPFLFRRAGVVNGAHEIILAMMSHWEVRLAVESALSMSSLTGKGFRIIFCFCRSGDPRRSRGSTGGARIWTICVGSMPVWSIPSSLGQFSSNLSTLHSTVNPAQGSDRWQSKGPADHGMLAVGEWGKRSHTQSGLHAQSLHGTVCRE